MWYLRKLVARENSRSLGCEMILQIARLQRQRNGRGVERVVGRQAKGEFVTASVRVRRELAAIAIGDQVVAPGYQLACASRPAFRVCEPVKPGTFSSNLP